MSKKLDDAEILDLLPQVLKDDVCAKAYSYAFKRQVDKILKLAKAVLIYPAIDEQPDYVLDMLAVEMQAPHYDQSYLTSEKATLIKGILSWYVHAGTKWAVQDLANSVFGEGTEVVEQSTSGDPTMGPYEFDVRTPAAGLASAYDEFAKVIQHTKNARSHLRKVYKYDLARAPWYIGIKSSSPTRTITAGLER